MSARLSECAICGAAVAEPSSGYHERWHADDERFDIALRDAVAGLVEACKRLNDRIEEVARAHVDG